MIVGTHAHGRLFVSCRFQADFTTPLLPYTRCMMIVGTHAHGRQLPLPGRLHYSPTPLLRLYWALGGAKRPITPTITRSRGVDVSHTSSQYASTL